MKSIMLGNSDFTIHCTKALLDSGSDVCAMISMPENCRPDNSADIALFGRNNAIPYHELEDVNSPEGLAVLSSYSPDFIYCEWPKILGEGVFDIPKGYCIGTHPTDLPYNRGRHPLHWCICLGISTTSLSFFKMDRGVDTGDILLQIPFSITPDDSIADLNNKMNIAAYEGTKELCKKLIANAAYVGAKQNHSLANYWRKRTPHDVTIDPRMSSDFIKRAVRSYTLPYSCVNLIYEKHIIKIVRAKLAKAKMSSEQLQRIEPGKIISIDQHTIRVKVDDGIIDLECLGRIPEELQRARYIHPPTMYISRHNLELA